MLWKYSEGLFPYGRRIDRFNVGQPVRKWNKAEEGRERNVPELASFDKTIFHKKKEETLKVVEKLNENP